MRKTIFVISSLLLSIGILTCLSIQYVNADDKIVVGYVEKVRIYPGKLYFHAKLDTGARNSSINAENIEEFEKDGTEWVRFDVVNHDKKRITLELPLVREATIKRHFGNEQYRPVVVLGICLGGMYKEVEVSLIDRKGFIYELLIGRSYLRHNFLIDPAKSYTKLPSCKPGKKKE